MSSTPSQFASDAFGLSKDQWEQGHTKTGKGVIGEIYDNTYEVAFRGGYIWYIERQWTVKNAVTADAIETESTLLIPKDSHLITTYSPEGRPETVVKLYMSEGLKDRFSSESWVGGESGNFTVQYNLWDYGVTRMIIATGNNP